VVIVIAFDLDPTDGGRISSLRVENQELLVTDRRGGAMSWGCYPMVPFAAGRQLARRIPGATLVELDTLQSLAALPRDGRRNVVVSNHRQRYSKRFAADLRSRHVPNFVWISPDQCNDMHGISASTALRIESMPL